MRILIINPNSDAGMTEAIQASAEAYAGGGFEVATLPTPEAPRFLETYEDEIRSGPGMLRIIRDNEADYDAFIIACHSDSNIHAARELTTKPVIGICAVPSSRLRTVISSCLEKLFAAASLKCVISV